MYCLLLRPPVALLRSNNNLLIISDRVVSVMKKIALLATILIYILIFSCMCNVDIYGQTLDVPLLEFDGSLEAIIPLRDVYSALYSNTIATLYIYKGVPKLLDLYDGDSYLEVHFKVAIDGRYLWIHTNSSSIVFHGYGVTSRYKLSGEDDTQVTLYTVSLYRYNSFYLMLCFSNPRQHLITLDIYASSNLSISAIASSYSKAFSVEINNKSLYLVLLDKSSVDYRYTEQNISMNISINRCMNLLIGFDKALMYIDRRSVYNLIEFSKQYFANMLNDLPRIVTKYKSIQKLYTFSIYIKINRFSRIGYADFSTNVNPLDLISLSYIFKFSNFRYGLVYLLNGFSHGLYDLDEPVIQYSYLDIVINLYKVYGLAIERYVNEHYLEKIYNDTITHIENKGSSLNPVRIGFAYLILEKMKEYCSYTACRNFENIDSYLDSTRRLLKPSSSIVENVDENALLVLAFASLSNSSCIYIDHFIGSIEKLNISALHYNVLSELSIIVLARCNRVEESMMLLNKYFEYSLKQKSISINSDYLMLYGFYRVDIEYTHTEQYVVLNPSVPPPLANTSIHLYINRKKITIHYLGWGSTILSLYIDVDRYQDNKVPLDKVSTYSRIVVELDKKSSASLLTLTVTEKGAPVKFKPITIYASFYNFSTVLHTDDKGVVTVSVPCLSPLTIYVDGRSYTILIIRCLSSENITIDIDMEGLSPLEDSNNDTTTKHTLTSISSITSHTHLYTSNNYMEYTKSSQSQELINSASTLNTLIITLIILIPSSIGILLIVHLKRLRK